MCRDIGLRCACSKDTAIVQKWKIIWASKQSTPRLRLPNVYHENSMLTTKLFWANNAQDSMLSGLS